MNVDDAVNKSCELIENIKPMFAGQHPDIVGAVLVQLLAVWLAGHHPDVRDEVLQAFLNSVAEMVPVDINYMIEVGVVGPEWLGHTK